MPDGDEASRAWIRLSDHENRIRDLEALQSPAQKQIAQEFRDMQRKVAEMDTHGTTVTQVRLKNIEDDIHDIKKAIADDRQERKDEVRAVRQLWRSGMIAVGSGVIINLVVILITRAAG